MRLIRRRLPRGSKPAPVSQDKPIELPKLIGKTVELYLQGEPLAQDEHYGGKLLYVTSTWVGFVGAHRAQYFFDHVPLSSTRKIRDATHLKLHRSDKKDPYQHIDLEGEPQKLVDIIDEEVVVSLQGHQLLRDGNFRTRLVYVKKNWVGVASVFNARLLLDHIPMSSIRKITKVVLRTKPGRFGFTTDR
jgi:hypothetical protein